LQYLIRRIFGIDKTERRGKQFQQLLLQQNSNT